METDKLIVNYRQLFKIRQDCWDQGIKITYIPGCWDGPSGPHLGHCICVDHCKSRRPGNILVIGIANDDTVRMLKDEGRPICTETIRARMMAMMKPVDFVTIVQESGQAGADGDQIMQILQPDLYVADQNDSSLRRKRKLCREWNCEFVTHSRYSPWNADGISTTKIVEELAAA